jgi:hypothetical protein
MRFTRATQLAFQSVTLALLSIASAVLGTIEAAPDVLQGAFACFGAVLVVVTFCSTIATLFASDQEIDADKAQKSKV